MGYHLREIPKGVLGEWSKVEEELAEFEDAKEQGSKILMLVELSDIWGALVAYTLKHNSEKDWYQKSDNASKFVIDEARNLDTRIEEIIKFSRITERAFMSGERTSGTN